MGYVGACKTGEVRVALRRSCRYRIINARAPSRDHAPSPLRGEGWVRVSRSDTRGMRCRDVYGRLH